MDIFLKFPFRLTVEVKPVHAGRNTEYWWGGGGGSPAPHSFLPAKASNLTKGYPKPIMVPLAGKLGSPPPHSAELSTTFPERPGFASFLSKNVWTV